MSSKTDHLDHPSKEERGLVCAKCHRLNAAGGKVCKHCGAHLFVTCPDCGHRNERVMARCGSCGRRLHRSWWRRLKKRLFLKSQNVTPLQLALLVLGVLVGFAFIVFLLEFKVPAP
ncbi:MAG: zinc ribbon domain-containing protein [Verrucomicrobiota bacterium]